MSTDGEKTGSSRSVFMFSYNEHQWETDGGDWTPEDEILRQAATRTWARLEEVAPEQAEKYCDEEIRSLDDLMSLVRGVVVEEWGMPVEAAKTPIDKMRERMAREGWDFVGGSFNELEGNHNDSEIFVVLDRRG